MQLQEFLAMHDNNSKQHIVIVGDGLDAFFTAAALSTNLSKNDYSFSVILHPSNTKTNYDFCDSTQPDPKPLHHSVCLNEDYLVSQAQASFTFGIALSGWNNPRVAYFHPYSSIGAKLDTVAFHHLAMRLRDEGIPVRLANFALSALAAQANRLQRPLPNDRSVLSSCEWGLHINTKTLATLKRKQAEGQGVNFIQASVNTVEIDKNGHIDSLNLDSSNKLKADLFIDCTGQEAKLINALHDKTWISWSEYLPCDKKVSLTINSATSPAAYSFSQAHTAGWIRQLGIQGKTTLSNYFHSAHMSDEQSVSLLSEASNSTSLNDTACEKINFGRRQASWLKNCIAIGTSSVEIDPIGVSRLQLLRSSLSKLAGLFPRKLNSNAVIAEYNRRTNLEFDNARDFAMLHYKLNGRTQDTFWKECRTIELPEVLEYKLKLYQARGHIALYDEEPLQEQSWVNLYDEHGIKARNYNPLVYGFKLDTIKQHMHRIREIMLEGVAKMPTHANYLAQVKNNFNNK